VLLLTWKTVLLEQGGLVEVYKVSFDSGVR
jgi:hypothetical protein